MTTLQTTTAEIINLVKPSEVFVKGTNYLQCIIDDNFCEFQKCYINKKWYKFHSKGRSDSPIEVFEKFI